MSPMSEIPKPAKPRPQLQPCDFGPHWNSTYYDIMQEYYWDPKLLGRVPANPAILPTTNKCWEPKGVEVDLPDGVLFTDQTGDRRGSVRARWWELPDSGIGYDGLVFPSNPRIPAVPVTEKSFAQIPSHPLESPPVFFGHYLKPAGSPLQPERRNVAFLDHSASTDGPLVAYRLRGAPSSIPPNTSAMNEATPA